MKKFIPILFTTDMMVANLQGIKNQTRRGRGLDVINENPNLWELHMVNRHDYISVVFNELDYDMSEKRVIEVKSPYGQPGDVLWFREKWRRNEAMTGPPFHWYALNDVYTDPDNERWKPGIHMPASACRAFGVIEEIRIERLRDISEQDAIDEGIECVEFESEEVCQNPINAYLTLFESINGEELTARNPWLWVVKYKFTTEEPEGWKEYVQKLNKEP